MKEQRQDNPTQGAKGKKRKRKDESGVVDAKKHARSGSTPQKVPTALHAQPAEVLSGFQRMDEETTTYLNEVKAHLDTLEDGEEISLLVCLQPSSCTPKSLSGCLHHLVLYLPAPCALFCCLHDGHGAVVRQGQGPPHMCHAYSRVRRR